MDTEQSLELAVQHHTAGRLPEAEQIYRQILQVEPSQPVALHLLGVLAHQVGNSEAARELISKAIAIKPDYAEAHNNLGLALQGLARGEEAAASYQRALDFKPDYPEAHCNLGNALLGLGKAEGAAACYQKALAIKPDYLKAHNNLGLALRDLGRFDAAVRCFETAIALNPDYAEAHSNLGNILKEQGKLDQAVASFHAAIAINPGYAQAHNNLGLGLFAAGQHDAAIDSYRTALSLRPDYAEAQNNLGLALHSRGKLEEARTSIKAAIALNPADAAAHNNLGNVCKDLGLLEDAIAAYRDALRVQPDYQFAAVNLLHQLRHACQWPEVEALQSKVDGLTLSPFDSVTSNDDGPENLVVAKAASQAIAKTMSGLSVDFKFPENPPTKPRITLGYLSGDFHNHATAHLMRSLFKLHDRNDFNVLTFSHGQNDDSPYRAKIIADSDRFFDLQGVGHVQAAQEIYRSGVDILIDLKGHTHNNRLEICALRPAPLQVSYLGFPGSSGADFIDYMITDHIVTPADQAPHFSEQLVYLPHSYQVNDGTQEISDVAFARLDFALPEEAFVFCSFNSTFKIEPVMFDVWMTLLEQTPGSVLWLYRSNDLAEANLKREAQARGIDAERLIFTGKLPKDQHLARYRLADLALDTRICGGHTTTSDALWAGLPVLTMIGSHFASRVSASLLAAIGMPELICKNLADYQALALNLAHNPAALGELKAKLALNRLSAALFDTSRLTKNLESAYHAMWETYLSGNPPVRIDVIEE